MKEPHIWELRHATTTRLLQNSPEEIPTEVIQALYSITVPGSACPTHAETFYSAVPCTAETAQMKEYARKTLTCRYYTFPDLVII
jgi:hypothetical protein